MAQNQNTNRTASLPLRGELPSLFSWAVVATPGIAGLLMIMLGSSWIFFFGLLLAIGSTIFIYAEYKEVPAKPPHIGVLTVGGRRLPKILEEGYYMLLSIWPFFIDFIPVKIEFRNEDFTFRVRCKLREEEGNDVTGSSDFIRTLNRLKRTDNPDPKSGGEVEVDVSITWEPDYKSGNPQDIIDFLNAGEDKGVVDIFNDDSGEDLRQMGRRLTWLNMSFATDLMSAHLIQKLTNERMKRRMPDGTVQRVDVVDARDEEEIINFLHDVRENGISDVRKLGIRLIKLNVTNVRALGKLAESAEAAAVEVLKREGLLQNAEALRRAMDTLRDNTDGSLTHADVLEALQAEDKVIDKKVTTFRVPDVHQVSDAVVNALNTLLRR